MPHKKAAQTPKHAEKPKILIVEDDQDFALGLLLMLKPHTSCVESAATLGEALRHLEAQRFDVILLDLSLPDSSGLRVISSIREHQPSSRVLVLTGHNDAQLAVQALRLGAKDYLTKPIRKQELLQAVETAHASAQIHLSSAQHRLPHVPNTPTTHAQMPDAIGDSRAWMDAIEMIQAAASAPKTTILLTGEPGVGKEVAARLIHQWSQRAEQIMLAVNVAGLPGSLLESELFGHEVGAFTGASTLKRGLFEQAEKGTLFLDEIGELPLELQAKLLRVLEGQPFRRLGGEKHIFPKARLISATNRPLESLVSQGLFREDLYHRLKVLEIRLPPLRERQTDIEKLALHFLAYLGAEMGHSRAYFAPETIRLFQIYSWPGNVRELRNVVERALVLSRGDLILPRHLPRELRDLEQTKPTISFAMYPHSKADDTHITKSPESRTEGAVESHVHTPPVLHIASGPHPKDLTSQTPEYARSLAFLSQAPRFLAQEETSSTLRLEHVIVQHIQHVLEACEGNVTRAAEILGITRQTLRRRLREIVPVEDG